MMAELVDASLHQTPSKRKMPVPPPILQPNLVSHSLCLLGLNVLAPGQCPPFPPKPEIPYETTPHSPELAGHRIQKKHRYINAGLLELPPPQKNLPRRRKALAMLVNIHQ